MSSLSFTSVSSKRPSLLFSYLVNSAACIRVCPFIHPAPSVLSDSLLESLFSRPSNCEKGFTFVRQEPKFMTHVIWSGAWQGWVACFSLTITESWLMRRFRLSFRGLTILQEIHVQQVASPFLRLTRWWDAWGLMASYFWTDGQIQPV